MALHTVSRSVIAYSGLNTNLLRLTYVSATIDILYLFSTTFIFFIIQRIKSTRVAGIELLYAYRIKIRFVFRVLWLAVPHILLQVGLMCI